MLKTHAFGALAVETLGPWSADVKSFIKSLSSWLVDAPGDPCIELVELQVPVLICRYTAHGVKLTSQAHLELLAELSESLNLDEWQHGAVGQRDALFMVSPENKAKFLEELEKNNVENYVHLENVAA